MTFLSQRNCTDNGCFNLFHIEVINNTVVEAKTTKIATMENSKV